MKKLMAVLVCLAILFSVLPCCFAETEESFVFRDGIVWGMSEREVMAHEKQLRSLFCRSEDGLTSILQYEKVKVSTHGNSTLTYLFKDGKLSRAVYTLNDADESTVKYIVGALASKYGEASLFGYDATVNFFEYLYDLFAALRLTGEEVGFDPDVVIRENLNMPEEALEYFALPGATWELPDGTQILSSDKPLTQTPMLMYLCPESERSYDIGGL